jgi:hypothetical protein
LVDISEVILDWWKLELADVPQPCTYWDAESGYKKVDCSVVIKNEGYGDQLVIPISVPKNVLFNLTIQYFITNESMSASFLTPVQTSTKV